MPVEKDAPRQELAVVEPPGSGALSTALEADRARAREVRSRVRADATLRAYQVAWRGFTAWAITRGVDAEAAPAQDVAAYLVWLADQRPTPVSCRRHGVDRPGAVGGETMGLSAIRAAYSAIAMVYRHSGVPGWEGARGCPALVREQLDALKRTLGVAPRRPKEALMLGDVRELVETIEGDGLPALRDRALLLVDFFACDRRSETVALNVEDLAFKKDGATLSISRSKTDQEGKGLIKGLVFAERETDLCPVRALRAWLDTSGLKSGAVFRAFSRYGQLLPRRLNGRHVTEIIKAAARDAGWDEPRIARVASHSLRAGFITEANDMGKPLIDIAEQSGHRDLNVLRGYVRHANALGKNNPSRGMI